MNTVVMGLLLHLATQPSDAPAPEVKVAPKTWTDVERSYVLECRAPFGLKVEPTTRELGSYRFRLLGSRVVREPPARTRLVMGVLSALKDVTPATRANVKKAVRAFKKAKVDLIVANGDVALNEFDLEEAMDLLGETGFPVFVSIGNSEGRGAFNRAFVAAEARHPNLFNLNWLREVDLGWLQLVSLPGYYNRPFIHQKSGCHYDADEVERVGQAIDRLHAHQKTVVLIAHGPPKSRGAAAIDRAAEYGNVGDPAMQQLIVERELRFGLFGHILEAGGRGSTDVRLGKRARPGKRYRRLYVNAGAASSMPWKLLGGPTVHGMAMIVTFEKKGASYKVIRL